MAKEAWILIAVNLVIFILNFFVAVPNGLTMGWWLWLVIVFVNLAMAGVFIVRRRRQTPW